MYAGGFVTGTISVISGTATVSNTTLFLVTGLTSTWTQLQIVYPSLTGSGTFLIYPDTASPVLGRTIYVWGAQLNPGSTAQTYYPTTTAAYYAPRFDYSPTNIGEPRGLLIEGQSVNLLSYSADANNAYWTKYQCSIGGTLGSAPDNTTSATLVVENSGSIDPSLQRTGVTVSVSSTYTFSAWFKAAASNPRRYLNFRVNDNASNSNAASLVFDSQTGTISGAATAYGTITGAASSIVSYPGSWYCVSLKFTIPSTGITQIGCKFQLSATGTRTGDGQVFTYTGDGVSGMYVWGAQLELGSGASSYIPTGASQVTRNADICYMAISTIGFSTSGGTFFTSFYRGEANLGLNQAGSAINTDYADTRWLGIGSGYGSTTFGFGAWNGALNKTGAGVFGLNKAAGSYASWVTSTTGAFTVNGATAVTGTLSNLGTTPNYLMIGSASSTSPYNGVGLRDFLNNSIRSIKYFPTAFTAAQLQTLTAP
jgi:hypothetical protein